MSVIDEVSSLPVLRPLVGMDKEEIVAEARRLGTYQVSIIPDEDCCTLFTPKHPATRARRNQVEASESALQIDELVQEAVSSADCQDLRFPPLLQHSLDRFGPTGKLPHGSNKC